MAYSVALAVKSLASDIAKPIASAFLAPIFASSTASLVIWLDDYRMRLSQVYGMGAGGGDVILRRLGSKDDHRLLDRLFCNLWGAT
jgi:hypothetical protein